jgi:hypothetical protein
MMFILRRYALQLARFAVGKAAEWISGIEAERPLTYRDVKPNGIRVSADTKSTLKY